MTYKEIALALNIKVRTVAFHVQAILTKTNTHSSAEAIFAYAQQCQAAKTC